MQMCGDVDAANADNLVYGKSFDDKTSCCWGEIGLHADIETANWDF
jgi:hypothetical protein